MAGFQSRLCNVCREALDQAFNSIRGQDSDKVPHHLTKDSLVDSVLARSCHLCRQTVDMLKLPNGPSLGPEEHEGSAPRQPVTALSADDFKASDFEYANFASDRLWVRRALGHLPEDIGLTLSIRNFGVHHGLQGMLYLYCTSMPRISSFAYFWIISTEGMLFFTPMAETEVIISYNIVLSSIHRLSWSHCSRQDNRGKQLSKAGCRMVRSLQEAPSCMY